jgi:hypothetical protein
MKRALSHLSAGVITKWFLLCIAGVLFGAYLLFQARLLLGGPSIVLDPEPAPVQTSATAVISGHAANIAELTLNGRPIYTTDTGVFEEELVLETGYTIMTLEATDRYGNTERLERTFVYQRE